MNSKRMTFQDIVHWILDKLYELRDAAFGSFIYFLYGHFYQKRDLYKGLTAFFIGTVFAIYLSPPIQKFSGFNIEVVSFLTGLLGMRITEALVNQDFKEVISSYLGIKLKTKPVKKSNNE